MADYTEDRLSGSTNGRPIKVVQTATAGTLIHTDQSSGGNDKVYLWAVNTSAADVKLTLEWGGVTSPDDLIEFTVPAEDGAYCIAPGWLIAGGVTIGAFADTGNVVNIIGHVTRIK